MNLSEDQLRRVIARAIEIDRRPTYVLTEAEIRTIAAELDVSDAAITEALAEAGSIRVPTRRFELVPRWVRHWRFSASGVLIGLPAGILYGLDPGPGLSRLVILAVYGAAAASALRGDGEERHVKYQLRNAGLWIGVGAGVASFGHFSDPVLMAATWGAIASAGGAALIWLRDLSDRARHYVGGYSSVPRGTLTDRRGDPLS